MVDFDSTTARRKLSKEAREVLRLAETLGYRLDWASQKQQAIALTSNYDDRKLLLPMNSVNANRLRSLTTQVIRHAGPEAVKEAADLTTIADKNRRAGKIPHSFDIASGTEVAIVREGEPLSSSVERAINLAHLRQREEAEARLRQQEADERTIRDANDDDEQVAELVAAERNPVSRTRDENLPTVVSESPWMVRRGGHEGGAGRMYESHSVIHRVWSDGHEDYRCRFCTYESDNPRGVAGHASRTKVGHPASTAPPEDLRVNEYVPTEIKRPLSGIRRLTSELTHALDGIPGWEGMDREELARTLAEHVYAMRPDPVPTEPLTPEQIIRRITLMVEGGRLAEMHQQVEATAAALREKESEAEALSAEAAEMRARVEMLQDERRALRDLLASEDDR